MTHYEALGVRGDATQDEIRAAYRALAKQYHPDKIGSNPQAQQRFQEIAAAYEVLQVPERRAAYDQQLRQEAAAEDTASMVRFGADTLLRTAAGARVGAWLERFGVKQPANMAGEAARALSLAAQRAGAKKDR